MLDHLIPNYPSDQLKLNLRTTDVVKKLIIHQTVLLNFHMVMKWHILMPDQRA